ncbi:MAG TPA: BatA domain-containing protein, partial [Gemmatimonadales bacterium]
MLGVTTPLWLAALAALAVPIALHLWSRRSGRAVRVGSIRLLGGAPPAMARRPRLHDPWLLALRCALLAALVLA